MKHVKLYENFRTPYDKGRIEIKIKKDSSKTHTVSIDVQYDMKTIEFKLKEIGNAIQSIDKDTFVDIGYSIFNTISNSWMNMITYYPTEKRLIYH